MKKRLGIGLGLLLVVVAIIVFTIPENRLTILGYVSGENRFQGRPTSYWQHKVELYAAQKRNSKAIRASLWDKVLKFLSLTSNNEAPEKPQILSGGREALPVLADLIKNKKSLQVSLEAYAAVATLGRPNAPDILPLVKEELRGPDFYLRPVAVHTLARLGQDGIPCLIEGLKHEGPDVRQAAADTLYEMAHGTLNVGLKDALKDAVPALVEALDDKVEVVRYHAALALLRIDPEEADKRDAARFPREHLAQTGSSKAAEDGAP